jgi:magnesium and cobalt exporter, CNNM family
MFIIITLLSLLGAASLAGTQVALVQLGRLRAKEEFKKIPSLFFFQHLLKPLFGQNRWEGLFLTLSLSKHLLHLIYALSAFFLFSPLYLTAFIIILVSLATDTLLKFFATLNPKLALHFLTPIASLFLLLFAPLAALALRLFYPLFPKKIAPMPTIRDKILDVLYESELSTHLDPQERKLILSVANFKQRSVKEVMVPRIDVISLSDETPLSEAALIFLKERYSRLPIYQNNIDHIVGVLLYKDILSAYTSKTPPTSIRSLIKPVLYTPETKKIAQLLQEFRIKQIHLAIVVDEYGGTEGIITVEDILEELVGEIADEDDLQQELLYSRLPSGGWIVDARMTILDLEKELGMKIPLSPEYDTLGGYIYHRAGAIPTQGWRLHHDDFDLEILSSDERSIEKVKILPHISEEL